MADICDVTSDRDELMQPMLLAASRKPEGPAPTGFCLYCDEPVGEGRRWCDSDCMGDWQRVQR